MVAVLSVSINTNLFGTRKFQNKKGFQGIIKSTDSTNRTRAGEAYRLGFLRGPIIDGRFEAKHEIPLGWKEVIDGKVPHSRLGLYAYLIGRAMQQEQGLAALKTALDSLATVQILHIAFKVNGKWYCTVAFFEYARKKLVDLLRRDLDQDELRYLAGAVFNTLDGGGFEDFLNAMLGEKELEKLFFSLQKGGKHEFNLVEFESLVTKKTININDIKNHKAALFWSSKPRGLYSRAATGDGEEFLSNFLDNEISLYRKGEGSALSLILENIARGDVVGDIFDHAETIFSDDDLLKDSWDLLVSRLNRATRICVEKTDFATAPKIWRFAQRSIFGSPETKKSQLQIEKSEPEVLGKKEEKESITKKVPKKITDSLPASDEIKFMAQKGQEIFCDVPEINVEASKTKREVKKSKNINYLEKTRRDSELGKSGEEFVYELEVQTLINAGKKELAKKVLWVSKEIGDGVGYDILSFDAYGKHKFIEVKTTKQGPKNPFYLSSNELEVSLEKGSDYKIYRLFNYPKKPNIYVVPGPLNDNLNLTPTHYLALPINHAARH